VQSAGGGSREPTGRACTGRDTLDELRQGRGLTSHQEETVITEKIGAKKFTRRDRKMINSRRWQLGLGILVYVTTKGRERRDGLENQLPATRTDWR